MPIFQCVPPEALRLALAIALLTLTTACSTASTAPTETPTFDLQTDSHSAATRSTAIARRSAGRRWRVAAARNLRGGFGPRRRPGARRASTFQRDHRGGVRRGNRNPVGERLLGPHRDPRRAGADVEGRAFGGTLRDSGRGVCAGRLRDFRERRRSDGDRRLPLTRVGYFSSTRVPRIFWLLSALRKSGTSRSISSKYDDSAGMFCCAG